jgi:predicted metalloprotease
MDRRPTRLFRRLAGGIIATGLAIGAVLASAGPALADEGNAPDTPLESSADAPQSAFSGNELQVTQTFATAVIQLVDKDWSAWFIDNKLQEPRVSYEIVQPGATFTSSCKQNGKPMVVTSDTANAFFCPTDSSGDDHGTIIVPVTALRRIWDGDLYDRSVKDAGDFTVATILAHEFGHHVVDELVRQHVYDRGPATPKNTELIADCFAGNWVEAAYGHGYLGSDPQQAIGQAVNALETLGDENLTSSTHHGTPEERANAIRIGLYGTEQNPVAGLPQNCVATYWD